MYSAFGWVWAERGREGKKSEGERERGEKEGEGEEKREEVERGESELESEWENSKKRNKDKRMRVEKRDMSTLIIYSVLIKSTALSHINFSKYKDSSVT